MNTFVALVPNIAGFLMLLFAVSHLFAREAIRGAGRIVCGIALVVIAVHFWLPSVPPLYLPLAAAQFGLAGILTIVCGARKYMRRNIANP